MISFFFFNDTATTEIYTLFLHDALPILHWMPWSDAAFARARAERKPILLDIGAVWCHWCHVMDGESYEDSDRKSTRLNSSHPSISYAVFCLKKKKKTVVNYVTCSLVT